MHRPSNFEVMRNQIYDLLEQHENIKISVTEIVKELKKEKLNLMGNPALKQNFIQIMEDLISEEILYPIKSSGTLYQYNRLPKNYTINQNHFQENSFPSAERFVQEITSLSSELSIDYYLKHLDDYSRNREYILRINDLVKKDDSPLLTVNERSYLLFGDEKAISESKNSNVNGETILKNLNLSLDKIKARKMFEPFSYNEGEKYRLLDKGFRTILIVENMDTFWTLKEAMLNGSLTEFQLIIYGKGNAIIKSFEYIQMIGGVEEDKYFYFGDIDQEGIFIFNNLRKRYSKYDIQPAVSLYNQMLKKTGALNAKPVKGITRELSEFSLSPFIDYFSEKSKFEIEAIISSKCYLPQEIVNCMDIPELSYNGLF